MDYEKKYKEALEWARKVMQGKVGFVLDEVLEKFPELKESEDERIRKSIIAIINNYVDNSNTFKPEMIAWLEKQGEPQVRTGIEWVNTIDDACDKRYSEEYAHGEYCHEQSFKWGFQEGVDWLDWFEKQGEKDEEILILKDQIESLHAAIKALKEAHKIELEKQGEQKLPIEKLPLEMKTLSESLGFTSKKECDDYNKMVTNLIMSDDDNGEQKELKKEKVDNLHNYLYGEQKPVEWSSEQSKTLQTDDVPNESSTVAPLRTGAIGFDGETMESKPCEQNTTWNKEDDYVIERLFCLLHNEQDKYPQQSSEFQELEEIGNKLMSFKNRVQPKPKWSEEDERIYIGLYNLIYSTPYCNLRKEFSNWLKSLKDRYTWKPSEEEMVALEHAINCYSSISPTNTNEVFILEIMKERLKNLMK